MGDFVFNISKGRHHYYASLPAAADALIVVLLKNAGLEADDTLNNYDDLSALLGATNDEADFTGYSRKTLASVTATVDDTNNRADTDAADPSSYTNTGGASQQTGKALVVYDADTGAGTDANIIPVYAFDCLVTFDVGVPVTLQFNASGMGRST